MAYRSAPEPFRTDRIEKQNLLSITCNHSVEYARQNDWLPGSGEPVQTQQFCIAVFAATGLLRVRFINILIFGRT